MAPFESLGMISYSHSTAKTQHQLDDNKCFVEGQRIIHVWAWAHLLSAHPNSASYPKQDGK